MAEGYSGFATLGDMIAGGPGRRAEKEYPTRLKQNFDAFEALEAARIRRAQAMARDALPAAVAASGIQHPDLASAVLGMATGQPNLSTYTGGLQDLGDMELQRQQVEAAQAGDIDRVNLLNAVAGDKLLTRTRIAGGVAYDPYAAPDLADMVLTPAGAAQADATALRAQATAAKDIAHAGVYEAQAEQGGFRPGKVTATNEAAQQAKIDFIMAEGTRKAAKHGDAYAQAWVNNEMAKAGFAVQPLGDALEGRTPATRAWTEPEIQKAINDARRAIKSGRITPEAARQRLLDAGLSNAAGRI